MIRLGFEPKTHSLEGCCSIQLSYQTIAFADAKIRLFSLCQASWSKFFARVDGLLRFLLIMRVIRHTRTLRLLWLGDTFLRTRLLDLQLVAHENGLVGLHDGLVSLGIIGHLHETVALGATRLVIHDDLARLHFSKLFKQGTEIFRGGLEC